MPATEPRLYFCRDGKTVEGPFDADIVRQMVERKELSIITPVCRKGTEEWIPFHELPAPPTVFDGIMAAADQIPEPTPSGLLRFFLWSIVAALIYFLYKMS